MSVSKANPLRSNHSPLTDSNIDNRTPSRSTESEEKQLNYTSKPTTAGKYEDMLSGSVTLTEEDALKISARIKEEYETKLKLSLEEYRNSITKERAEIFRM
jgi:ClpP class serine protease